MDEILKKIRRRNTFFGIRRSVCRSLLQMWYKI